MELRSALRIKLFFLAIVCLMIALAAWPAMGLSETTPGSDVHLVCGRVYWASWDDYIARQLTVDYGISNNGPGPAYNATIFTAEATRLVTASSVIPIWLGDLDSGASDTVHFKWTVPQGVQAYRTTISICSDCAPNICVDGANGGIDIKPGSCPNPINIGQGNAQVAVAVFSNGGFNALTIDHSTVIFAGASPANMAQEDKNGDGRLDMLYHFSRNNLDLQVGDQRACLSASIVGGGDFRSCDMVIVQ
jgi:hypothetical protein